MTNIFSSKKAVKKDRVEEDFIPSGGVLETDIYKGTLKYLYLSKAQNSDARAANICVEINGREVTQQIWMTNKDGDVTYKDKRSGEEKNLPGYNQVNSLAMLLAGKDIGDLDVEEKTLNLYDFDAKKELPRAVDCFVELHGEELHVAVQKKIVDKRAKDESTGEYEPTGETREINEFVKFFPASGLVTISEIAHFVESLGGDFDDVLNDGDLDKAIAKMEDDGAYATKWLEKNRGQTYDASTANKGKKEGKEFKGSKSSGGDGDGGKKKAKSSLFDD